MKIKKFNQFVNESMQHDTAQQICDKFSIETGINTDFEQTIKEGSKGIYTGIVDDGELVDSYILIVPNHDDLTVTMNIVRSTGNMQISIDGRSVVINKSRLRLDNGYDEEYKTYSLEEWLRIPELKLQLSQLADTL